MKKFFRDLFTFASIASKRESISKLYLVLNYFVCLIIFGFTIREYFSLSAYKMSFRNKKTYVTYFRAKKLEKWFNKSEETSLLNDKALFNQTFKSYVLRNWIKLDDATDEEIATFLNDNANVLLKPRKMSSGIGICVPNSIEYVINNKYDNLLEERIVNHPIIKQFSDKSLNTIRVYTLKQSDGEIIFLSASLRVGAIGSLVDNMHGNGHSVAINIETGKLFGVGKSYDGTTYKNNPFSGLKYDGIQLPFWQKVLESVRYACNQLKEVRYNAWDIAITPSGVELIEGNVNPDPNLMQMHLKEGNWHVFKTVHYMDL